MSIPVEIRRGTSINTTIAREAKEVDEGIGALMSNYSNYKKFIGLDTITCRSSSNQVSVALLQLCDKSQCVIFRFTPGCNVPESIYNFLSVPAFTFVGFGIKDTVALLRQEYGIVCKNYIDTSLPAFRRKLHDGMYRPSTRVISQLWDLKENIPEELILLAVSNAHAAFCIANEHLF